MFRENYFEGWYFKCNNKEKTISFIPSYHRIGKSETASMQIISDDSAVSIPHKSVSYRRKPLYARIGNCIFSEKGIRLDIHTDEISAEGELKFSELSPLHYDIMGPFSLVPFMQCRHSVYSMKHRIDGQITVNGQSYLFRNGTGYIEGDRGRSFPERYIWTQCCYEQVSVMMSVADIPMFGFNFTGTICVFMLNGKEYRLATYLGAKIERIGKNSVSVIQGGYQLFAELIEKNAHPLLAPDNGIMSRTIHESACCKAYYRFSNKGKKIFEFSSERASFEFEY